jgi:hypothetical protein
MSYVVVLQETWYRITIRCPVTGTRTSSGHFTSTRAVKDCAAIGSSSLLFGCAKSALFIANTHMAPKPAQKTVRARRHNASVNPDATKILVSTKNAMILVWPNECNLQKVHARAQRI